MKRISFNDALFSIIINKTPKVPIIFMLRLIERREMYSGKRPPNLADLTDRTRSTF